MAILTLANRQWLTRGPILNRNLCERRAAECAGLHDQGCQIKEKLGGRGIFRRLEIGSQNSVRFSTVTQAFRFSTAASMSFQFPDYIPYAERGGLFP